MPEIVVLTEVVGTYSQHRLALKLETPDHSLMYVSADSYSVIRYDVSEDRCYMRTEVMLPRDALEKIFTNYGDDEWIALRPIAQTIFDYLYGSFIDGFDTSNDGEITQLSNQPMDIITEMAKAISTFAATQITSPGKYKRNLTNMKRLQHGIICRKEGHISNPIGMYTRVNVITNSKSSIKEARIDTEHEVFYVIENQVGISKEEYKFFDIPKR